MEAAYDNFCPNGVPAREKVIMTMDEYETIRLVDLEKCTHEQCAKQMGIARTTVTEIYESARYKMADSIVNGKTLEISGGNYRLCDGTALFCCNKICRRTSTSVGKDDIQRKETDQMRIAVTYENGEIFQHFGHTEQFKLYDIENSQVVRSQIVEHKWTGTRGTCRIFDGGGCGCADLWRNRRRCAKRACNCRHKAVWWSVRCGR